MDMRSPLVIGSHDLGRRPGAMRTHDLEVPAPGALAIEVIGVPAGSPLRLELRLESVMDGVLATGAIHAQLVGECVRCLRAVTDDLSTTFQELFAYPGTVTIDPDDENAPEIHELTGDFLDLEQVVRDAVVLALPFQPLCDADCPGLCPDCGIRWDETPEDHHHEVIDARWAALVEALRTSEAQEEPPST